MNRFLPVAAGILFVVSAANAQVKENITVSLVEVPVTVADSHGNPVRGLTARNFELMDNGVKRPITTFDVVDFGSKEPLSATSQLPPAARRNFLLMFDLSNSSPNALARAKEAARRFVATSVQPFDLVAVGTVDADRSFRVLSSFTTDRPLIAAAIANPENFRAADPLGLAKQTDIYRGDTEASTGFDTSRELEPGAGKYAAAVAEHQHELARMITNENRQAVRQRVEKQIDALGQIAAMLRAVPGRKQILYLSEGFDASSLIGRDVREAKDVAEENTAVLSGELWKVDNDNRYGSSTSNALLTKMVDYFRRSDVVLNAIDIEGVRVQNDVQKGLTINSNAGLAVLSRPTGGDVFQNSNDLGANFERLLHRQEVVYILGFAGETSHPGVFHRLSVRLADTRRGSRASVRSGYFEAGGDSGEAAVLSDAAIIAADIPQSGIHVATLASPVPAPTSRAAVPVIIDLNREDVTGGQDHATVELFTYAFDSTGVVRDAIHDTLRTNGTSASPSIRYYETLTLPPGKYAIKTLVRVPQTGRKGYVRTDLEVPPPRTTSVSPPLFLEEPGRSLLVRGISHGESTFPFHINGVAFMPAAAVSLSNGVPRRYVLYVYHANADTFAVDTTLIDSSGNRHRVAPTLVGQLQGVDVAKLVYDITATALEPGEGRMEVVIHEKESAKTETSSLPIVVRQ